MHEKSSPEGKLADELSAGDSPCTNNLAPTFPLKPGAFLPANGDRVFGREFLP